jgi:hypothetical protein
LRLIALLAWECSEIAAAALARTRRLEVQNIAEFVAGQ